MRERERRHRGEASVAAEDATAVGKRTLTSARGRPATVHGDADVDGGDGDGGFMGLVGQGLGGDDGGQTATTGMGGLVGGQSDGGGGDGGGGDVGAQYTDGGGEGGQYTNGGGDGGGITVPIGVGIGIPDVDITVPDPGDIGIDPTVATNTVGRPTVSVSHPTAAGTPITFDAADYRELYRQVSARADTGKEAGSVTRDWSVDYKTLDDQVKSVAYTIPLATSLPEWPQKKNQPADDQRKFDGWRQSVSDHEAQHRKIYKDTYARLKTAVVGPTQADCEAQSQTVDDAAEAAQVAFDGSNQPAPLPAPGGMEKVPPSGS